MPRDWLDDAYETGAGGRPNMMAVVWSYGDKFWGDCSKTVLLPKLGPAPPASTQEQLSGL